MPFYDKTNDDNDIFNQFKKNRLSGLIMPKGEGQKRQGVMEKILDDKGLDPERKRKCIELYESIKNRILDYNQVNGVQKDIKDCIDWQPISSEGGSHEGKDVLWYLVIYANGLVILEPINEYANATYIYREDEYLEWKVSNTREEIVKSGIGYKISHELNKNYTDYNYDAKANVLRLLDAVLYDKERFMKDITPEEGRNYCNARKVFRKRDIRDLVEEYDITYLDLREVVKRYSDGVELPIEERELVEAVENIIDDDDKEQSNLYQKIQNYIPRKNGKTEDGPGGR